MRLYFFPLLILTLFFLSSVFLTVRQEALLEEANQQLVAIGYVDPSAKEDTRFFIRHEAEIPRTLTLEYSNEDRTTTSETVTLAPKENRTFTPPVSPVSITVRYQDHNNQEQSLILYKK